MVQDKKIVITDRNYPDYKIEKSILKKIEAKVEITNCKTEDEVIKVSREADGIIVVYAPITKKVIQDLNKCKIISKSGMGLDSIDVQAATEKDIAVTNVPSYCEDEVSNLVIGFILNCNRKICLYNQHVKSKIWDWEKESSIYRFSSQVVGLVGLGKIAREVARKIRPFGINLIAYDPYISEDEFPSYVSKKESLEDLFLEADYVSIHVPLSQDTKHLIDMDSFYTMKESAYLINASRGAVVNNKDLYKALNKGEIQGAALDVIEDEPEKGAFVDNPFLNLSNVIITPHVAWYSEEAQIEMRTKAAKNIVTFFKGETPLGLVNDIHLYQR